MPITNADKRELEQTYSDYSDKYTGRKEDYFACLYLKKKFKTTVEDIARQCAFGNNDYGVDAYYIDRDSRNLYLYQFKWSVNQNLFRESLERLAKEGMERIFGNALQDPEQNELLRNLKADLYEYRSLIQRVFVHYVFKGDSEAAEKSDGLQYRKENVLNKRYLLQQYFNNPDIDLQVEFFSDARVPPAQSSLETYALAFSAPVSVQTADGQKKMHVAFVPLMDLYRIYKGLGQRFLDRNIRSGLKDESPPKAKIRDALAEIVIRQKMSPDLFAFNHNGVTIAAEQLTIENGRSLVEVPRLLNGAQTITSIARFLKDNESNPALTANAADLEAIKVLTRIVVDDPFSDFIKKVTVCNNRQIPVEPWNLRANDRIQCDLHDKFKDEVHVYYSRQENAFANIPNDERELMGIPDVRDIRIRPLAQTFLAIQGEIAKMSQLPEVFENEKLYEACFREAYLRSDARKIILAYKIHLLLNGVMQRLDERAGEQIGLVLYRARNVVWALLIQGILNDEKLHEMLENYGNGLGKEADFREYLKTLASSRLLPVFRTVLQDDMYKERMHKERYDFVRTIDFFKRCMDVAGDKFKWSKKSV